MVILGEVAAAVQQEGVAVQQEEVVDALQNPNQVRRTRTDASTFPAAASCVHSFADLLGGEPQHHIVANLDTFYGCTEFG